MSPSATVIPPRIHNPSPEKLDFNLSFSIARRWNVLAQKVSRKYYIILLFHCCTVAAPSILTLPHTNTHTQQHNTKGQKHTTRSERVKNQKKKQRKQSIPLGMSIKSIQWKTFRMNFKCSPKTQISTPFFASSLLDFERTFHLFSFCCLSLYHSGL